MCDTKCVHGKDENRYCGTSKLELIQKCLKSLVASCNACKECINFIIIDDGSTRECKSSVEKILKGSIKKYEIISSKNDYNKSTLKFFDLARKSKKDFVYCVEDDYLHFPEAVGEMLYFIKLAQQQLNNRLIALHPFDDPDNYGRRCSVPTNIVLGKTRHWRTNFSSTCTIFSSPAMFQMNWDMLEAFANNYNVAPDVNEDNTINTIWKKDVSLFSPVRSLALHMQFEASKDPMVNWKKLWDQFV